MNVLKPFLRITIATLLATATPQREIERRTGVDRKTIRRYARCAQKAKSPGVATGSPPIDDQTPPPRPPASDGMLVSERPPMPISTAISACAPHRAWIEAQVALGRNAEARAAATLVRYR